MVSSSGYQNGMTNGMGYIGLAAMIFGNWRPTGLLIGAGLFGYTQAVQLRNGEESLHALLLVIAVLLLWVAFLQFRGGRMLQAVLAVVAAALAVWWYLATDEVPREFTGMAPYVADAAGPLAVGAEAAHAGRGRPDLPPGLGRMTGAR